MRPKPYQVLAAGLTQELMWDGKDDHGVPVSEFRPEPLHLPPPTLHRSPSACVPA